MRIDITNLDFIDLKLRRILIGLEAETGFQFTITSLYRINDTGVHGTLPLRGIDLRCHNPLFGVFVEEYINERWEYDADRPNMQVCIYHDAGSGNHLHIQVCDATRAK